MDIKQNIKNLFEMKTNYAIWKDTGIAQTTLGDYTKGVSDIGNMKLDHAIKLNDYYLKLKEMEEMSKIEKLLVEIEANGKELVDSIELENDNRDVIIICDDNAEDSDGYFLYEAQEVMEAYGFLQKENLLK